ncbi:MAG: bifunctional phosphoribosylaminoimidazolecarboxamide formyltransferase/IMP cyclohydrolase, partial [Corynebacterium casei]|nr:bifunctional phosphoribosylaminoimidazolecarboxamide formyltransferase/IMP cyclohydrolase [Corynebacterium casei]
MSDDRKQIKRALISVYDKTGLEELARTLDGAGVEIVSTGSTAAKIADLGINVTPVETLTGFPECLEGRVKTLHPRVHAGILADTRKPDHLNQLEELEIAPFQLVVVNLYPFRETVASGADFDGCVEQIDIGGPSMVRAAAKNHPSVAVVVDPAHYGDIAEAVAQGGFDLAQRRQLAATAFKHTADYDVAVSGWFAQQLADDSASSDLEGDALRYGENPHQKASVVREGTSGVANAKQLHGKEMSYNNYQDADAAWRAAWDHERPCVAIIKHANPCGIAVSDESIAAAHAAAHACDPMSAFGGVIAVNREVTKEMATQVADIFTEVIIAPSYEDGAVEILQGKKNIRILVAEHEAPAVEVKEISGGRLLQEADVYQAEGDQASTWTLAAGEAASEEKLAELEFAWRAVRSVKSNAILLAHEGATVGVGMGQV